MDHLFSLKRASNLLKEKQKRADKMQVTDSLEVSTLQKFHQLAFPLRTCRILCFRSDKATPITRSSESKLSNLF